MQGRTRGLVLALVPVLLAVPAGCTAARDGAAGPSGPATGTGTGAGTTPATAVDFTAADGTVLHGTRYGHGTTAVVLSNMGDNDPAPWQRFAPLLAARGYTVLSYGFRYRGSDPFTTASALATVVDLRAAMAYLRGQGARRLVLLGASLGGMASAKAAAEPDVAALVVLSSPADLSGYGLVVTAADLATAVPKLFVLADGDPIVPPAATRALYGLAGPPREVQTYPAAVHGLALFGTASAGALTTRLLDFVGAHAPPG